MQKDFLCKKRSFLAQNGRPAIAGPSQPGPEN